MAPLGGIYVRTNLVFFIFRLSHAGNYGFLNSCLSNDSWKVTVISLIEQVLSFLAFLIFVVVGTLLASQVPLGY